MIILITGATHTGKTFLSNELMKELQISVLSLDHLKMGLIRSKMTLLTPTSSLEDLTNLVWPVARGMIKTAIENKQSLIVEGCYVPSNFTDEFEEDYLKKIHSFVLLFSKEYISNNKEKIEKNRNVVENRGEEIDVVFIEKENEYFIKNFTSSRFDKIEITESYNTQELLNQIKKYVYDNFH